MTRPQTSPVVILGALAAGTLLLPVLLAAAVLWAAAARNREARPVPASGPARPACVLTSSKPYGTTSVPFTLRGGSPFVTAVADGRRTEAMIDTGAAAVVLPSSLAAGSDSGPTGTITDANGQTVPCRRRVVHSLRLGAFVLRDFPVAVVGAARRSPPRPADSVALIGNAALTPFVVTVDYPGRRLILRQPEYTPPVRPGRDMTLDLAWEDTDAGRVPLVPVVAQGRVLHFALDTGWSGPSVGLTRATVQRLGLTLMNRRRSARRAAFSGYASVAEPAAVERFVYRLRDARGARFGDVQVVGHALVVAALPAHADGVFGAEVLLHFRVPLDFPRKRLILSSVTGGRQPRTPVI